MISPQHPHKNVAFFLPQLVVAAFISFNVDAATPHDRHVAANGNGTDMLVLLSLTAIVCAKQSCYPYIVPVISIPRARDMCCEF